jgi:hypothetical protein
MSDQSYASFVENLIAADRTWSEPLVAELYARVFLTALYQEALRAVVEIRQRGGAIELRAWVINDSFDISQGSRKITFSRKQGTSEPALQMHRQCFPSELVPWSELFVQLEVPPMSGAYLDLARRQMMAAVELLFAR